MEEFPNSIMDIPSLFFFFPFFLFTASLSLKLMYIKTSIMLLNFTESDQVVCLDKEIY